MPNASIPSKLLVVLSVLMIGAGLALGVWAVFSIPFPEQTRQESGPAPAVAVVASSDSAALPASSDSAGGGDAHPSADSGTITATMADTGSSAQPLPPPLLIVDPGDAPGVVSAGLLAAAEKLSSTLQLTTTADAAGSAALRFSIQPHGSLVYTVTFAAATRFDTVDLATSESAIRRLWTGEQIPSPQGTVTGTSNISATAAVTAPLAAVFPYTQIAVLSDTLPALQMLLGDPAPGVAGFATIDEVVEAAWQGHTTLALVPFDLLQPRLAVLAVDGQNPLDNAAYYDPTRYPLIANVYAELPGRDSTGSGLARKALAVLPAGNRLPQLLTVVAMTGVTAMTRQMAAQMDRRGSDWPAADVGQRLAAADITHVSNEVPFVEGCEVNLDPDNYNFCSKPEYMAALTDLGVDIIGLTGNHQNDFGRENALKSLAIYAKAGLPVYGGGVNKQAAFAPLIVEHNGNRLAFLGANSYGPKMAWATDDLPGSAQFDLAIMSAQIRELKQEDAANVVLAELQYQESYDTQPLVDQRQDFTALTRAGADIVTGVQSHVPQGIEFTDGKIVLYGLGNLYFDQMNDLATREGLVVEHTIYNGRHLGTQLLTTLVYDYGQPRWTSGAERDSLLKRVFAASYW